MTELTAVARNAELARARTAVVVAFWVNGLCFASWLSPAGPPLIGFLAGHTGILHALFVVLGALIVGGLVTSAARPLASEIQRRNRL